MFLVALFIIAQTWKSQRCPSVGEWGYEFCYLHIMAYYEVLKGNEISSHGRHRRNLNTYY